MIDLRSDSVPQFDVGLLFSDTSIEHFEMVRRPVIATLELRYLQLLKHETLEPLCVVFVCGISGLDVWTSRRSVSCVNDSSYGTLKITTLIPTEIAANYER